MPILPSRSSFNQSASAVLSTLKGGNKEIQSDFIWNNQERFYAIALLSTDDPMVAEELTIQAFQNVFIALKHINPKQIGLPIWEWLAQYIVAVCADYHLQKSVGVAPIQNLDPAIDGSSQMDWETTVILGAQRVRRCLISLPKEQQKVFILRHQMSLDYHQTALVLSQSPETIMAWLYRARVQIVKCLGRG
jgi:RNA polymerase sigma factor (sigma-70 family)